MNLAVLVMILALFASVCLLYNAQSKPFKLQLTWNDEVKFLSETFDVDDACKNFNQSQIYCPLTIYQLSEQQSDNHSLPVVVNLNTNNLNFMSINNRTNIAAQSQNVIHLITNIICLSKAFTTTSKTAFPGTSENCFNKSLTVKFENYVNLFQLAVFFNNEHMMGIVSRDIIRYVQNWGESVCLNQVQINSISSSPSTVVNSCEDLPAKDWFYITCVGSNHELNVKSCAMNLQNYLRLSNHKLLKFLIKTRVLHFFSKTYADIYHEHIRKTSNDLLLNAVFHQTIKSMQIFFRYREELGIDETTVNRALLLACKLSPLMADMMMKMSGSQLNVFIADMYGNNMLTLLSQIYHMFDNSSYIHSCVSMILRYNPKASILIDSKNFDGYTPYMIAQELNHTELQKLFDQFRQPHVTDFHKNLLRNKKFFEQFTIESMSEESDVSIKPNWFLLHKTHNLVHDDLYLEMVQQFGDAFIVRNVCAPLRAYTDENPLRIELFDKMKALATKNFENYESFLSNNELTNHDEYHSNAIQLAWKIIGAIKHIRKFNYSTKIDCKTEQTNRYLSPYLIDVPIQYYHGSFRGLNATDDQDNFGYCMTKDDPHFEIRFRYMYRAIWIHSSKIDFNLLKHPTNFNSWSVTVNGAFTVIHFFANQVKRKTFNEFEVLGSWPFRYLVILVAEIDWNLVQSITKWYPNAKAALQEKELVIPPFCNYEIDPKTRSWDDLSNMQPSSFRSVESQRKMLFPLPFFGKHLRSENIVVYNVTKINCENWDDWFAKIA